MMRRTPTTTTKGNDMTSGQRYASFGAAAIDMKGCYRCDPCGCKYDDGIGEQVACCDEHLAAKRRRTVRTLVKRRHAITMNARRVAALRSRYASLDAGSPRRTAFHIAHADL